MLLVSLPVSSLRPTLSWHPIPLSSHLRCFIQGRDFLVSIWTGHSRLPVSPPISLPQGLPSACPEFNYQTSLYAIPSQVIIQGMYFLVLDINQDIPRCQCHCQYLPPTSSPNPLPILKPKLFVHCPNSRISVKKGTYWPSHLRCFLQGRNFLIPDINQDT